MPNREAQEKLILDSMTSLRMQVDTRMLFVALLAHAGVIGETLIAGGITNAEKVTSLFAEACADAIKPREAGEEKPRVVEIGDDPQGRMH